MYAETENAYNLAWHSLQYRYDVSQLQFLRYLQRVWLPYKETFVRAWTDKIRHFGNVDSSRTEGIHQAIKRRMGSKQIHLNNVVDHLSRYLDLHNRNLREELEFGQQNKQTDLQSPLYHKLHGRINYYAIDQVETHRRFFNLTPRNAHRPLKRCTHVFMTTKGLPYAHVLQQRYFDHLPLEIADFDIQ